MFTISVPDMMCQNCVKRITNALNEAELKFSVELESKTVTIAVPEDSLRQFDYAMKEVLLPGKIEWFLCDSGETKLEGNFVI